MSKHTPGPWWLDDDGFIASGDGDTYETIADPHCSDLDIDEREANASLIAAAPELLEALEHITQTPEYKYLYPGTTSLIEEAIAKAKGH